MYLFNIAKIEGRRSGKDRRIGHHLEHDVAERRSFSDRRILMDRRGNTERRAGVQYILTEEQKSQLESMYDFLEQQGLG